MHEQFRIQELLTEDDRTLEELLARLVANEQIELILTDNGESLSKTELVARIAALTRRLSELPQQHGVRRFGDFELDVRTQKLTYYAPDGTAEIHKLSFREMSLLDLLISAKGGIVENRLLLTELWGNDEVYNLNSLYVFITRLKQYLSKDGSVFISNVRGVGYRLVVGHR